MTDIVETDEIRKFSDASIQHAIDTQIAISGAKHFAVVAITVKQPGTNDINTKLTVWFKLDNDWSFGGFMTGTVKNPLREFGAEIRFAR